MTKVIINSVINQLPLLLRKLNLIPYPVQLAEINTERKVQQ